MIETLYLHEFGRFSTTHFSFAATTVFYGTNEAGKTTVFDALFKCLCAPPGNRQEGKRLQQRYGKGAGAEAVFSQGAEAELPVCCDEFFQLYAVRGGDIQFATKEGTDAFSALKAKLLTGGLDPAPIVRQLAQMHADRKNSPMNKRLAQLREDQNQLRETWQRKTKEREELLQKRADLEAERQKTATLQRRKNDLNRQLAEKERQLHREEERRELDRKKRRLTALRRLQELTDSLDKSEGRASADPDAFEKARTALRETEEALRLVDARITDAETNDGALQKKLADKEREEGRLRPWIFKSRELSAKIEAVLSDPPMTTRTRWRPVAVFLAAVFLILTGVLAWQSANAGLPAWSAWLSVAAAAASALAARSTSVVRDRTSERRTFETIRNEWNREAPGDLSVEAAELSDLRRAFDGLERRYETELREMDRLRAERQQVCANLEESRRRRRDLGAQYETARAQRDEHLAAVKASSADEYYQSLERYRHERRERDRLASEWEVDPQNAAAEAQALAQDLRDGSADDEEPPRPENEWQALKKECACLRRSRDELLEEEAKATTQVAASDGELRGRLEGLPEEIVDCESRLQQVEGEIADLERTKDGARLARELFEDLTSETDTRLSHLSEEVASWLSKIDGMERKVDLRGLTESHAYFEDRQGALRAAPHLSAGTRDFFLFAARLALARKASRAHGFLILDDPFLAFDRQRQEAALTLLHRFQTETGAQLIIFSKDDDLPARVEAEFPEARVHHLA